MTDQATNSNLLAQDSPILPHNELKAASIDNIFTNGKLTEEEKTNMIQLLCNRIEFHDISLLSNVLNQQFYSSIINNIGDLTTEPQLALLKLLEIIVEFGFRKTIEYEKANTMKQFKNGFILEFNSYHRYDHERNIIFSDLSLKDQNRNKFQQIFNDSGIINYIETALIDKIKHEEQLKESQPFSNILAQLSTIYMIIKKGKYIRENIVELIIQICEKNVEKLIQQISGFKFAQFNNLEQQLQISEEMEIEISNGSRLIHALSDTYFANSFNFVGHNLHEKIVPLFHINCPEENECLLNINIPLFPSIVELKESVYHLYQKIMIRDQNVIKYLKGEHDAQTHASLNIIHFANQINFHPDLNDQEQNNNISPLLALHSVILHRRIMNLEPSPNDIIPPYPEVLNALAKLANYRINNLDINDEDQIALNLRFMSHEYLYELQKTDNTEILEQLITHRNFISAQIKGISICDSPEAENTEYLVRSFSSIYHLHQRAHNKELQVNDNHTFQILIYKLNKSGFRNYRQVQTQFKKLYNEQTEEEGQNEEIEAHLFRSKNMRDNLNEIAVIVKKKIQSVDIDPESLHLMNRH